MDADYSKREIDEHFKNVQHLLGDVKSGVDDLNKKVGIQNGRVAKLEGKAMWVTGVGFTLTFLMAIIMGLIVYSFQISQENLKNSVLLEVRSIVPTK